MDGSAVLASAGMMAKPDAAEPRISSSSAAGEPPGGGGGSFTGWHAPGGAGEQGGESVYAGGMAGAQLFPPGSPHLGMFGAAAPLGGAMPQFGMIPVAAGPAGAQQVARDASGGGSHGGGGGGGPQLSGASSLGAPSPLPGPSGDDGGSSSGSMPPPGARALPPPGGAHHHAGPSSGGGAGASGGGHAADAPAAGGPPQVFRSEYRGVSYDKKKRKWRVQIKVAALGKSGVSVGYFDTETAAARAYDRAAIGLLGRSNCRTILNFPIEEYDNDSVPELVGESSSFGAGCWALIGGWVGGRR
jgi:hypothetical protein